METPFHGEASRGDPAVSQMVIYDKGGLDGVV
ncbi:hypothetical protein GGR75_003374 [Xanthomonas campestris]|jgi:hypothetical protein|nr:hypothetical protein [Xanthomonas campestris]MCW1983131.1 hypothetical protein [Xanthomonas campestris]MCW2001176.1 hypothetical protein [Xanthomonas campestris]MCW2002667.1 hypothetical protein [Xanthomonas campestris]MCW2008486.1 hypothetical protein [Xanthomonas campestris]